MKRCNANFMVDVARGKQTWRPTGELAQKRKGRVANLFLPVSLEKENYLVGTQIQSQAKQEEHEALRENSSERV